MIQIILSATLFPILAWYGLTTDRSTDAAYKDMAAAHFNISTLINTRNDSPEIVHQDNMKAMEIASKHGVRLMVHLPEIARFLQTGSEEDLKQAKAVIRERYRGKPGLYGYMLQDEPSSGGFEILARATRACLEADPDSLPYINLLPTYANAGQLGNPTYEAHVEQYIQTVHPKVLSYDHYAILSDGQKTTYRGDYYHNLAAIRDAALRHGIPSWAFSLSVPHGPYPMPTEGHVRWQIFHDLAYGMKGIQYFTYETPLNTPWDFRNAPLDAEGNKTPTWYILQRVNAEVLKLGPTLLSLTSTNVQVTGKCDDGCKLFEAGDELAECTGSPAVISLFNGPAKSRYLMVVNRDFMRDADVRLKLATGVSSLAEISKKTGKELTPVKPGAKGVTVRLNPGDGKLFRILK